MSAVRRTSVDIPTKGGTADAYLVHPDDHSPHPAVLLSMDAFGLRPSLKSRRSLPSGSGLADRPGGARKS